MEKKGRGRAARQRDGLFSVCVRGFDCRAALIGEDRPVFAQPWPGWVDQTVRPDVVAYDYFLCGFDAFHRLSSFNRLALAWRVFGQVAVNLLRRLSSANWKSGATARLALNAI
jgi:hypothetical protein